MPLITRQGKGSKLTIQEMDGNLTYLQSRSKYKFATLPNSEYPSFVDPNPDIQGNYLQIPPYSAYMSPPPLTYLENGHIANVVYCQSVLENGILIYESYDAEIDPFNPPYEIYGYWLAFEVDAVDPTKLNKVGELKMTQQFWDNWYSRTKKNPLNKNSVKFVYYTNPQIAPVPPAPPVLAEAYITTLTYANGTLTAVDSITTFGDRTFVQLYEDLTGVAPVAEYLNYYEPEYIADDDYYGIPNTSESDWMYCFDPDENPDTFYKYIGLNLLTGETRFLDTAAVFANVTNITEPLSSYTNVISVHPKGFLFQLNDKEAVDDYTLNGVTAMWSPYWADPTKVTHITARSANQYAWLWTATTQPINWYWDNNNIYTGDFTSTQSQAYCVHKIELGKQDPPKVKVIPLTKNANAMISSWSFNDFILYTIKDQSTTNSFGQYDYLIWQSDSDSPFILQSNNDYPTNAFGDKIYCTNSSLNLNALSLGFEYGQYDNLDLKS